jgi:hypothetical protein
MSNREPQILLKADERSIVLELSRDGKFAAKSSGWGENLVCLEGRQARCCGQERALVLTRIPARPRSHLAMPIRSLPQHRRTEPDVCTRTGDRKDCRAFSKAEIRWSIS